MSSFIFFVVAPIMLYLLHPYAKERNLAVHLVWLMMIFVGKCPLVLTCLPVPT
ncbi:alkaline ceramidase 1 [Tachysurus ichikawai]